MKKRKYQAWLRASMSNPVDQILVGLKKWEEASDWSKYFSLPNPSTRIWDVSEDIARISLSVRTSFPQNILFNFFFRIYITENAPTSCPRSLLYRNKKWQCTMVPVFKKCPDRILPIFLSAFKSAITVATSHGLLSRYFPVAFSANRPSKMKETMFQSL